MDVVSGEIDAVMVSLSSFAAGAPWSNPASSNLDLPSPPYSTEPAMPWLLDTLLRNLDFDLEQVADVIDPILTAPNYCRSTGLYIQGVIVGDRCFVASNLQDQSIRVTSCGHRWLLGTSPHCAITTQAAGIALYHAALGFDPQQGFSLTTLSHEARAQVNGRPLSPLHPYALQEGDRVQLGSLRFEFLQEFCPVPSWPLDDYPTVGGDRYWAETL